MYILGSLTFPIKNSNNTNLIECLTGYLPGFVKRSENKININRFENKKTIVQNRDLIETKKLKKIFEQKFLNQRKGKILPVEPKIIAKLKLTNNSSMNKYNQTVTNGVHQSVNKSLTLKNSEKNPVTTIYQRLNENTYLRHSKVKA